MDPGLHARAKSAARARKTTLSGLIEDCLRPVTRGDSVVDGLIGSGELREPVGDPLYDTMRARHIDEKR